MSYLLNPIQNGLAKLVGQSTAEICLNAALGIGGGYLAMQFAKSSALLAGVSLLVVEMISENSAFIVEHGGTIEKYVKIFLELLTLDEIYRRCAARGFLGGVLVGITLA